MAIFFHIPCTANMILFHLEIDFYFGMMVGVSGRRKIGYNDKLGLPLADFAMLCKMYVCTYSVLHFVDGIACDSKK